MLFLLKKFKGQLLFVCFSPGPLQESALWIDESQTVRSNIDHGRPTASIAPKEEEDPLGILDEGDRYSRKLNLC